MKSRYARITTDKKNIITYTGEFHRKNIIKK